MYVCMYVCICLCWCVVKNVTRALMNSDGSDLAYSLPSFSLSHSLHLHLPLLLGIKSCLTALAARQVHSPHTPIKPRPGK